jgi:peptidyl-dipeptidase A
MPRYLLIAALATVLVACTDTGAPPPTAIETPTTAATSADADADAFVARANKEIREVWREYMAAQWVANTYIIEDSQFIAARATERQLGWIKRTIEASRRFDGLDLSAATARAIRRIRQGTPMPAPSDPARLAELATISARLEATYGAGKHCADADDADTCRDLGQLSEVLAQSRDPDEIRVAWEGWHTISVPMRDDFVRFVELLNEGAAELGHADAGELWRSDYDMSPADFETETDRLWEQVKPLYEQLHCYARARLNTHYGDAVVPAEGPLPAHITGNMWAQDWSNVYDLLEPFPGAGSLDVDAGLEREGYDAVAITRRAEDFYTSLGMPALPESFYQRSMLTQPRDRDVVCHASAWDMDMAGDVRIKQCIKPTEEEFRTVYHELGHIYYYLAYNHLPPLFQTGAHDGFHEAIGDTVLLSLTPEYMHGIGLVGEHQENEQALINSQMKLALEKIVFLPFGKLIDQWRWAVFSGRVTPDAFNQGWWDLRLKYQGVAPTGTRDETYFDPGAKYHVPANVPYTRYFLAHILQFQFHRSLCAIAGHEGPLHACSVYGNREAGERFWAMLAKGASQPWQQTLEELTGTEEMDATAIIDYFEPLTEWLEAQNAGRTCGW